MPAIREYRNSCIDAEGATVFPGSRLGGPSTLMLNLRKVPVPNLSTPQKSACPQSEGRGFVAFEIGKIAVKGLYPFIDPINPLVERTGTEAKRHDMIEVPNIMRPHAGGPDRVE